MKTNISKQIKYFKKRYNHESMKFELEEILLNRDNWLYVQIDASIRTVFLKYNCILPKYAIIEELSHYTIINLVRDNIKNKKHLLHWYTNRNYIQSDLDIHAACNSTDMDDNGNWIKYEFKII